MGEIRFSLILCSRQRTGLLEGLLCSVRDTISDPSVVEVLVGIDDDDRETQSVRHRLETAFSCINLSFCSRRQSPYLHRDYINPLARTARGRYLIVLNDDTLMGNAHWDVAGAAAIEQYLSDKPDRVVYGGTNDDTGVSNLHCFPLFSREAVQALGWCMPDERPTWGADMDVQKIYGHILVNRCLELPQIVIRHISHHNNLRSRDSVNKRVEMIHHTLGMVAIDYDGYVQRLSRYISTAKNAMLRFPLLVVYNVCGISGRDNTAWYVTAIHSILAQEFPPGFQVAVSGCRSLPNTKQVLESTFGDMVHFNWIDDILPLNITFNHTVRRCWEMSGGYDAVVYMDSGINFGNDRMVLQKLYSRYATGKYAMVSGVADTDHGLDQWGLRVPHDRDLEVPIGKTLNLHCQLFGSELYEAYDGRLLPDIFASDTSESIFSYMTAAIRKKMVVCHDVPLQHQFSMDGGSSGFRHIHPLLFRCPWSLDQMCAEGYLVGLGYEECKPVLRHDPRWYDQGGEHRHPELLREFIARRCFLPDPWKLYRNTPSQFRPRAGGEPAPLPSPAVSCILVSHNKPNLVDEAIRSVLEQSHTDWELIVVDSGVLYDTGYFAWVQDPRVKIIRSPETADDRRLFAMAPWCFNRILPTLKGHLVTYLCDDDLWYPNAFAAFAEHFRTRPHVLAAYAGQDVISVFPDGRVVHAGERRATEIRGRCVNGPPLDCRVDYLQLCHRKDILQMLPGPNYWPIGKDTESHADGVFLESIGTVTPLYPIDIKVGQNRRTPRSTYGPTR